MKPHKPLVLLVLLGFSALTLWALAQVGYFGIWRASFSSPGAIQVLADLVVCCGLLIGWLRADARRRGINAWPWVVGILLGGSLAVLTYLLVRDTPNQTGRS